MTHLLHFFLNFFQKIFQSLILFHLHFKKIQIFRLIYLELTLSLNILLSKKSDVR